jgi:hypothetical protein
MSEPAAIAVTVVAAAAVFGVMLRRDDNRLRRAARRIRQLEYEGIEEFQCPDPFPEEAAVEGAFLREPDGRRADTRRVLHDELDRARRHTRALERKRSRTGGTRRGKGAECLL